MKPYRVTGMESQLTDQELSTKDLPASHRVQNTYVIRGNSSTQMPRNELFLRVALHSSALYRNKKTARHIFTMYRAVSFIISYVYMFIQTCDATC